MKKIFLTCVFGLVILGMLTITVSGALYEYYDYSGSSYDKIYQAVWFSQTFTIGSVGRNVNQTTTSISIRMEKQNNPGAFTLSVTETTGNVPDITKTLASSTYSASLFGALQYYNLSFTVSLKPFVRYALVFNTTSTVSTDSYKIRMGTSTYAGGYIYKSINNGSSWTAITSSDCGFYIYGYETNISAGTLYEYYDGLGDSNAKVYGDLLTCQTFKTGYTGANESFYLTRVALGLKRSGAMTGQCWVHLRPTNSTGYPIMNTSYAHGVYDSASISNIDFTWVYFDMNTTYDIQTGIRYAITFNATGGSPAIYIAHSIKMSDVYAGGNYFRILSGNITSWTRDATFRTYGIYSGSLNVTISNLSPVNGSTVYRSKDLHEFLTYYNYSSPNNYVNLSFTKTSLPGLNSTTKVYFDGTLIYNGTFINGSKTIALLQIYGGLVNGHTYTWTINNSYHGVYQNFSYIMTFRLNISYTPPTMLPISGSPQNASLMLSSMAMGLGCMIFAVGWRKKKRNEQG